jgi:DinB superfamily
MTGAHFEHLNLRGVSLHHVRVRGAELLDVDVSGELQHVVVNGVDIGPLVEAELNRRMPERALMRPQDPEGFRRAWATLERLWDGTLARARTFPEAMLHERVEDEWSFIQTLRHLNFATAAWIGRMVLGDLSPWHPLDLPWDEAPGWDGIPWDRAARPPLDEVLAVRRARQAMMRQVVAALTDEQLAATVSRPKPGWPAAEDFPVRECLLIVLNEEWEHRLYAERDLTVLEKER